MSCFLRIRLEQASDYNMQISLHQNHWDQCLKVQLQWVLTWNEEFPLHFCPRCKGIQCNINVKYNWFSYTVVYYNLFSVINLKRGIVLGDVADDSSKYQTSHSVLFLTSEFVKNICSGWSEYGIDRWTLQLDNEWRFNWKRNQLDIPQILRLRTWEQYYIYYSIAQLFQW